MKKAFYLIEFIVVIAIISIFFSLAIPALSRARHKAQQKQRQHIERGTFQLGDTVIVEGMDITGKINAIYGNEVVDLLVRNTNGTVSVIERVNIILLKKVPSSWR